MDNEDSPSTHAEGAVALANYQVDECSQEQCTSVGRSKVTRHGLSVLMDRIRSISLTECS